MKILDFKDLRTADFALTDISVIYQTPTWDRHGNKNAAVGRKLNGFLLIDRGECCYEWADTKAVLKHGGLIYLGTGCKRSVSVLQKPFSFYRISFTVTDLKSGEPIVFRDEPWVVTKQTSKELFSLCQSMQESTLSRNGLFRSSALLFAFFDCLTRQYTSGGSSQVTPALEYVQDHYVETFDVVQLARMCQLSESQFYCVFKEETGMSPIRYKNHLRVEQAKRLLTTGESTIQEVAAMLGFENIYYFSRVFKSHTGLSPANYLKEYQSMLP